MKPKLLDSSYLIENKYMKIRKDILQFQDGGPKDFFFLEGPPLVMVFGLTPQNEIIFTRQYRPSLRKEILELPAGKMDKPGETPEEAARREFQEETGYSLKEIHYLGEVDTLAGRSTIKGHLFFGLTDKRTVQALEPTEESLVIERVPLADLSTFIREKDFQSMPSLALIAKARVLFPTYFSNL